MSPTMVALVQDQKLFQKSVSLKKFWIQTCSYLTDIQAIVSRFTSIKFYEVF